MSYSAENALCGHVDLRWACGVTPEESREVRLIVEPDARCYLRELLPVEEAAFARPPSSAPRHPRAGDPEGTSVHTVTQLVDRIAELQGAAAGSGEQGAPDAVADSFTRRAP